MAELAMPNCGKCSKMMTPENSKLRPEFFLCDNCYIHTVNLNKPQPAPSTVPSIHPPVWSLVVQDMQTRDKVGRAKYGVALTPHNGRDALVDLYQELLDAVVYCRQAIFERDGE